MSQRPQRLCIKNEFGRRQTLLGGPAQFERLAGGPEVLLLGLGPDPAGLAEAAELARTDAPGKAVYAMEAPGFKDQMPPSWGEALPEGWKFIDPGELDWDMAARAEVLVYLPGVRLFPSFWGPITGRVRWLKAAGAAPAPRGRSVILPSTQSGLITRELGAALAGAGLAVRRVPPKELGRRLPAMLREERPALFLTVNFRGLDPHGEVFHLLEAAGVPACAWCVDNPFHLISGLRSSFWKRVHLAVTDPWFLEPLSRHGAESVFPLPLATDPALFAPDGPRLPELAGRMAFVGRSAFPGRGSFFAGCKVPQWQSEAAEMLLGQGGRPDYAWWLERLDIWPLWPDLAARTVGLGAEDAGRERRFSCVQAASAGPGLTIYGDADWAAALPPGAQLRGPVDYYAGLADVYRSAAWTLNVTSLLLPSGLTQRHFDVWAAGGFLLSDDTPGLSLFPPDLAREIAFSRPSDIAPLARRLAPGEALREDLARAWREEVLARHTYAHRAEEFLERLGL
ncbi:glycosyltransferase family protein [Desulfocurvus sp. DL9XJH121]